MTNRAILAAAVLVAAGMTACGGDDAEVPARGPAARVRAVLSQAPDTGFTLALVAGDTIRLSPQTVAFYRRARYRTAWQEDGSPTRGAHAVHAAIASARNDGLNPSRYAYDTAARLFAALEQKENGAAPLDAAARVEYLADLDLVLSEGYMRYVTDLVLGTIDPEAVGRAWRIPRQEPPTEAVLRSAVRGDPVQIIDRLRPTAPQYRRLMSALARLQQLADSGGWEPLPDGLSAAEGDSTEAVTVLRTRMAASDDPREARLAQRGGARPFVYDRDLRDAVRHFQRRHALDDDGQLGAATMRELNHAVADRIAEVRLNLDRWRWLPNELGALYMMVNIAGFELEVVENHRVIEAMNVVVGQPGWTTPVFADTMQHLVVNPYWNPPPSILEEEIYPAMARDPGYLARNNFERTSDGRIRQKPGATNALGKYKFMFPNDDNIYLHDTPADHLFSRTRRDFSHGCIRLERPADLARLVLAKATSHPASALPALEASGAEKWITLKRPIPIYIAYFTTWVAEDGTLRFHHDVYGHDGDLDDVRHELLDGVPQRVVTTEG